jgi:hypothetical protein
MKKRTKCGDLFLFRFRNNQQLLKLIKCVWYLGYKRYSEMKSTQSSKFLSVVTDASDLPVTESESDDDSAVEE